MLSFMFGIFYEISFPIVSLVTLIKQVASNKSSLLQMIILHSTQTLHIFTKIIKTESKHKRLSKCQAGLLGFRDQVVYLK